MPITLKKDVWKVKDPSSGQYRGAAILSTTLPQDAAQIISESNATIQNIKDTAIDAVDTALNDESTGLIPKAEADRDAIDDSLNNASNGIIPTAQSDRDDIDDSLNNINDGIIPEAQANLATIAAAVQSQIGQGTDKTLSVAKGFADAKAAGMMVKVSNYQPGSRLDDPATSQDASQNTGYPVYKDSNRVWVKETYAELEVPIMDDVDELKSALSAYSGVTFFDIVDSGYIATAVNTGGEVDLTVKSNRAFVHRIFEVTPGTVITLNGEGWTTGRLWAFVDENNLMLSVAVASSTATNLEITAPANAAKCIINMYKSSVGINFIGSTAVNVNVPESMQQLQAKLPDITENVTDIVQGYVRNTNGIINYAATYAVVTPMLPVLAVARVTKQIGYRLQYAYYDANKVYIGGSSSAYSIFYDINNFGVSVKAYNQNAEYIVLSMSYMPGGTPTTMTPEEYLQTGNLIACKNPVIWDHASVIAEELNNIILENTTFSSDYSFPFDPGRNRYKNAIVSIDATPTLADTTPCTVSFTRYWSNSTGGLTNQYYSSPYYAFAESGKRKQIQFRIPCGVYGITEPFMVNIGIPTGSTLQVHSFSIDFSDTIYRDAAIQLNAHGFNGFGGPPNTEIAFVMAAKLGYKYCITIPKVTKDGIYVCFHDDDNIQGTLRNPDGTAIASEYQNRPISDFDYAELMAFDAGVIRGRPFAGEKVPLLETFFKICAETGMHPMLSVHPDLSGHWENIKALAKKYNVLDKLNIKAPVGSTMSVPMSTLLGTVESYTVDINDATTDAVSYMDSLKTQFSLDNTSVKLGIEFFTAHATDQRITAALNAGYFVAIANITSSVYLSYTNYIEKGVTQFTDDYLPCAGLRWY